MHSVCLEPFGNYSRLSIGSNLEECNVIGRVVFCRPTNVCKQPHTKVMSQENEEVTQLVYNGGDAVAVTPRSEDIHEV